MIKVLRGLGSKFQGIELGVQYLGLEFQGIDRTWSSDFLVFSAQTLAKCVNYKNAEIETQMFFTQIED